MIGHHKIKKVEKIKMKEEHKCICENTDWEVVIVFLMIVILAVGVSVWQNNPKFLWLLALITIISSRKCKLHLERDNE